MDEAENMIPQILLQSQDIEMKTMRRRAYKNILSISFAFMLTYVAYASLCNLQSSLNVEGGIGVASLYVTHSCVIVSCFLFTPVILNTLGCKWAIASCMFCYSGFAAANFHPTWYTMMPSSIIIGLASGGLWPAKFSYLTSSAIEYAKFTKKPVDQIINMFLGIFFGFWVSGQLLGNIIMSVVLQPKQKMPSDNETSSWNTSLTCGAKECPLSKQALEMYLTSKEASPESVLTLLIVFLFLMVIAVFPVIFFVDKIEIYGSEERRKKTIMSQTLLHLKRFRNPRMALLLPLLMFQGMLGGFVSTEFTRAYLTCSYGVSQVGFILISYSFARAIVSAFAGKIVVYAGRKILIPSAGVLTATLLIVLRLWTPNPESQVVTHVIAATLGVCLALWNTQLSAFLGTIFKKDQEAAFSIFNLCDSLGMVIIFSCSNYICIYVKIYLLISWLTLAMIMFFIAEYINTQNPKKSESEAFEEMEPSKNTF